MTLIPSTYLEEIGADTLSESYELQGFDGQRSLAESVRIDVAFLSRTFRGRFLITNSELGILGRDVMNHVALLLDGPSLHWQEH